MIDGSSRHRWFAALLLFALAYPALNLLPRELGRGLSIAVCELAGSLVGGSAFDNDLLLQVTPAYPSTAAAKLDTDSAWTAALSAQRLSTGARAAIGINLRKSLWVPFTALASLALASALWYGARSLLVLLVGGLILQIPLTLALGMHVCAVLYENYVIDLSQTAQAAVRFSHAIFDPPGMVYAIPITIWAALTFLTSQPQQSAR